MTAPYYQCPGRGMPQPEGAPAEGFVACYRAGHHCPPKVANTTFSDSYRFVVYRCPCCGDFGGASGTPLAWGAS